MDYLAVDIEEQKKSAEKIDWLPLFLISFAALFFEVLVIRWVASEIRIFSYFKNLTLMGAIVGLGVGCATGPSRATGDAAKKTASLLGICAPLIAILSVILATATRTGLTDINFLITTEVYNWLPRSSVVGSAEQLVFNVFCIGMIFILVTGLFDAFGCELGVQLAKHDPLKGYSINLLGSLAGVVAYAVLAGARTPPGVWLLVGCASLMYFYRKWWQIASFAICIAAAFISTSSSHWSPYYRVDTSPYIFNDPTPYQVGTKLDVNHCVFQTIMDFSDRFIAQHPDLKNRPEYTTYTLPYEAHPSPARVLIIGAGTGNDVASALRNGAKSIDAVEIDPMILSLGHELHPEHPYDDAKVHEHVQDGRLFLATSPDKYDVIVFGFVDSHTTFSTVSSVRLDNYLYTVESIKQATAHLTPDGVACLSFAAGPQWLRARLYQLVKEATGQVPLAFSTTYGNPNSIILVWGPGMPAISKQLETQHAGLLLKPADLLIPLTIPTDDWPFLYQRDRALSIPYVVIVGMLLLVAGVLVIRRFSLRPGSFVRYSQFFFLGAGFLLLETRAMLATSILYGSTWIVNTVVIGIVLIMALFANWLIGRVKWISQSIGYAGIFVSLILLFFVPMSNFSGQPLMVRLIVGSSLVGLPFLFSGLVFSKAFQQVDKPDVALGVNILGALLGGCAEYLSVIIGSNNLLILAAVIYATSIIARHKPAVQSAAAE